MAYRMRGESCFHPRLGAGLPPLPLICFGPIYNRTSQMQAPVFTAQLQSEPEVPLQCAVESVAIVAIDRCGGRGLYSGMMGNDAMRQRRRGTWPLEGGMV